MIVLFLNMLIQLYVKRTIFPKIKYFEVCYYPLNFCIVFSIFWITKTVPHAVRAIPPFPVQQMNQGSQDDETPTGSGSWDAYNNLHASLDAGGFSLDGNTPAASVSDEPKTPEPSYASIIWVQFTGLKGSARLNGRIGRCGKWDAEKERFVVNVVDGVTFENTEESVRVKKKNLKKVRVGDCSTCETFGVVKLCGRCKSRQYCSGSGNNNTCQKVDWTKNRHKTRCKKLSERREQLAKQNNKIKKGIDPFSV